MTYLNIYKLLVVFLFNSKTSLVGNYKVMWNTYTYIYLYETCF